jgi:hypothetical protein
VHANEGTLDRDALWATLIHEVFPGHGWFYDFIDRQHPPFVDHGAFCLIEGWATWCDWHIHDEKARRYAEWSRWLRLNGLRTCRMPENDAVGHFMSDADVEGSSTPELRMLYHFQYPGLIASYALGALWFESRLPATTPLELLHRICAGPVGDFMSLWAL